MDPKSFIKLAQQGNEAAFKCLVDNYKTYVYQLIKMYTKDPEDIVNEMKLTFKVMWENIGYFNADRDKFAEWIKDLVIHICVLKKYYMEDDEEDLTDDKISPNDYEAMLNEIRKYFEDPSRYTNHTLSKVIFTDFLSVDEIMLMLLKYMYNYPIGMISAKSGKEKKKLENQVYTIERKILLQYRRVKIHEKNQKRKDN